MIEPIIIVGCARSGTSMTAGIVNICGAFGGNMFGPSQFNQKGMFENTEVRNSVMKPYLKKINCDPMAQWPLPNRRQVFEVTSTEAEDLRNQVQIIMKSQGYVDGPWFIKCTKAVLVWYLWHKAFPKAKWIIVRRDANDIANSCLRTGFMRKFKDAQGWKKWVAVHEERFAGIKTAKLDHMEFWPTKVIEGDYEYAQDMIEYLGLDWQEEMVQAFVDPTLFTRGEAVNG